MPRKVAKQTLNASTIDILNVIRRNAPYEYQQSIPVVETERDIPAVGEIIYGNPAFSNIFINALINRIALVQIQSATFNNPYRMLKKGYLEFGETVEDIFTGIAKVVDYSQDKARFREFRRTLPDVKSAFYVQNWRVLYPVTIEDDNLKTAFLSIEGVQELIESIVTQVYTAREYDDFLLFKYLLMKAICAGRMYPYSIGDGSDMSAAAVAFRGLSSQLTFMSDKYNEAHVLTSCPRDRQVIFMDSMYNAKFDVEVLAAAFNMDRADFMGRLFLIDDFTTFDNARFNEIREATDGLEAVTAEELEALSTVKAVLLDERWFQIYDNLEKFTEKYVASGLYWNYFLHVRETIANSPFSDAIVFITDDVETYDSLTFKVSDVSLADAKDADGNYKYAVVNVVPDSNTWSNGYQAYSFMQTPETIEKIVAVESYGSFMFDRAYDADGNAIGVTPFFMIDGTIYRGDKQVTADLKAGDDLTFTPVNSLEPLSTAAPLSTASAKKKSAKKAAEESAEESTEN